MSEQRAIIAAVSPEGVIGVGGKIPWHYSGDLKRFKRLTMGATVIMGRKTWESIGSKPLPGRRNVVITSRQIPGVDCFADIPSALAATDGPIWFIGGAQLYAAAMPYCDKIDITYVPDHVKDPGAARFPAFDKSQWEEGPLLAHEDEPALKRREYRRRRS